MKLSYINIKFLLILFLIVSFLSLGLFQERCMAEESTIKIGILIPLTGMWSDILREGLKGAEIARDYINAQGGIQGKKVEYIISDCPDTSSVISECERLIDKVDIILPFGSSTGYAIAPICERYKKINWHTIGGSDKITEGNWKYLFRTCGFTSEEGKLQADFAYDALQKLGISPDKAKIAVFGNDTVFATSTNNSAEDRVKELGMNVVLRENYSSKTQDLSSFIMKLAKAKLDVALFVGSPFDTKLFFRQSSTFGFKVPIFVGTGAETGSGWFKETFGPNKVNTFLSTNYPIENISIEFAPGKEKFLKMYREYTGSEHLYSCHSFSVYTGMIFLWDVLKRAKSINADDIREAALLTDMPMNKIGNGWGCKFVPPGEPMMGQNSRAHCIVTQWLDGEMWTVWPIEDPEHKLILPVESSIW